VCKRREVYIEKIELSIMVNGLLIWGTLLGGK
jgi:hypothetical protein